MRSSPVPGCPRLQRGPFSAPEKFLKEGLPPQGGKVSGPLRLGKRKTVNSVVCSAGGAGTWCIPLSHGFPKCLPQPWLDDGRGCLSMCRRGTSPKLLVGAITTGDYRRKLISLKELWVFLYWHNKHLTLTALNPTTLPPLITELKPVP